MRSCIWYIVLVHYVMPIDKISQILVKCALKSTIEF